MCKCEGIKLVPFGRVTPMYTLHPKLKLRKYMVQNTTQGTKINHCFLDSLLILT